MVSAPARQPEQNLGPCPPALWFGVLGSHFLWLLHLHVSYAILPKICSSGRHEILHVLAAAFAAASIAGGIASWRDWRKNGGGWLSGGKEHSPGSRTKFLALLGISSSALATLIIVMQDVVLFFMDPCWH